MGERSKYFMDDMNYHRVAEFFDISFEDRKDAGMAGKLDFLYEWGLKKANGDKMDALLAIKSLSNSLGLQMKGKELASKLHQWARLDQDRQRIESKMETISIEQKGEEDGPDTHGEHATSDRS